MLRRYFNLIKKEKPITKWQKKILKERVANGRKKSRSDRSDKATFFGRFILKILWKKCISRWGLNESRVHK